jgi:hypothetical protein
VTVTLNGGGPVPTGDPLPRCCPHHPDWPTLAQHLLDDFAEASIGDVVREVTRAKDAVARVGLDDVDALEAAELIARHQLMMLTGRVREVARLDPESHNRPSD